MEDQATLGSEHLLPYEKGAASTPEAGGSFEDVASALMGETTAAPDEPPEAVESDAEEATEEAATEDESDDGPPDDSEVEEPDAPPSFRVRVDGQELEVPLPELLAGYSRQADYTRKTTEVANQRKALEAEAAEIRNARDQYAERLTILEKALTETMPAEPDWETLRKENPADYAALKVEHRERQERLAAVKAEGDRVRGEQEREFHQRIAAIRQQEADRLLEAIPEWREEAKAAPEKAKLVEYAASMGMDADYLDAVTDHRFVVLLRKAQKYDEMQTKGKAAIQEKVAPAAVRPMQPGGRPQNTTNKAKRSEIQRQADRLERTGRVSDAAKLFEHLF
jgi:hypothetical protein